MEKYLVEAKETEGELINQIDELNEKLAEQDSTIVEKESRISMLEMEICKL